MIHFKLSAESYVDGLQSYGTRVTFSGETLQEILPHIERFLNGCGFILEADTLHIHEPGDQL